MKIRNYIILLTFLITIFSSLAQAGEVTIVDSQGIVRATTTAPESGNVMFILEDSKGNLVHNIDVELKDQATDKIINAATEHGKALFCGVPSGVWQVTSNVDWAMFTDIKIESAEEESGFALDCVKVPPAVFFAGSTAGAALGTVAIGGTATAAAVGYARSRDNDNDDDNNLPLSPSS